MNKLTCFSGNSIVAMHGGKFKKVFELAKGDRCLTPNGSTRITCVIMIPLDSCILTCVNNGLICTPDYPIIHGEKWKPARSLVHSSCTKKINHPILYNVILESHHCLIVGGLPCVTWGHRCNADVVTDKYIGSNAVVDDLRKLPCWKLGIVIINRNCIKLDIDDNVISIL